MMVAKGGAPRRNHLFDAMRGLAAIMVVAMHFTVTWFHRAGADWEPFPRAVLAVDFFFLLSGFVIARTYEPRLAGAMSPGRFAEVRIVRLYPLFLLGLGFGVAKQLFGIVTHVPDASSPAWIGGTLLFNLLMLPPPFFHAVGDFLFQLNPPAWSLLMEMLVNLLFGLWLVRQSSRRLAIVVGLAGLACLLGIWRHGNADIGASFINAQYGLARALYGFTLGILLHRLGGNRPPRETRLALLLPLLLLAALAMPAPGVGRALFDSLAIFALFPALVWIGNRIELPRWGVRTAGFLGDTSYALYSIHNPLVLVGILVAAKLGLGAIGATTGFVLGMLIAAAVAVHFYDVPVRTRIAGWLRVRRSAPPQEL